MPLAEALRALANGLGADGAAIARHHGAEERCRTIAYVDARLQADGGGENMRRAYCQDVLGAHYQNARPATIWFLSDLLDEPGWPVTRGLIGLRQRRSIVEIAVIPLTGTAQQQDFIEFHFARDLNRAERHELEALLPTLVRSWAGRQTGLVTQAQMDERMIRARASAKASRLRLEEPILGMSNPARLSRAEFRVCLLLARGLSVKGVTDELGLSEATVRSHLRSIYSKTETGGHADLLYRILSSGPLPSDPAAVRY